MINPDKFFELAQLAEAAYADFSDPGLSAKDALMDDGKGFSQAQADFFLANWAIVTDGHRPNTASGYSSTLFKSKCRMGGAERYPCRLQRWVSAKASTLPAPFN